ncbi:MAG TPA: UDP binding domain-containing protein [Candidatus Limnocylindria bacterium]|nr:UDP binding domain-containing protein [Candidatus Limnocylindria bacterium]
MAGFTVRTIEERIGSLREAPVLVLGIAYRGDVREDAFSSAFRLRDELKAAGARVFGHDPYFDDDHLRKMGFEPYALGSGAKVRVAVLQAPHGVYAELRPEAVAGVELFVDGRNAIDRAAWEDGGVPYVGIGR